MSADLYRYLEEQRQGGRTHSTGSFTIDPLAQLRKLIHPADRHPVCAMHGWLRYAVASGATAIQLREHRQWLELIHDGRAVEAGEAGGLPFRYFLLGSLLALRWPRARVLLDQPDSRLIVEEGGVRSERGPAVERCRLRLEKRKPWYTFFLDEKPEDWPATLGLMASSLPAQLTCQERPLVRGDGAKLPVLVVLEGPPAIRVPALEPLLSLRQPASGGYSAVVRLGLGGEARSGLRVVVDGVDCGMPLPMALPVTTISVVHPGVKLDYLMTTVVRDEVYEQLERDLRADLERLMLTLLDRRETLPPGVLVYLEPLIRTRCLRGEFREALELTRFLAEPLRPLLTPQRLGNFQYRYGLLAGRLGEHEMSAKMRGVAESAWERAVSIWPEDVPGRPLAGGGVDRHILIQLSRLALEEEVLGRDSGGLVASLVQVSLTAKNLLHTELEEFCLRWILELGEETLHEDDTQLQVRRIQLADVLLRRSPPGHSEARILLEKALHRWPVPQGSLADRDPRAARERKHDLRWLITLLELLARVETAEGRPEVARRHLDTCQAYLAAHPLDGPPVAPKRR